MRCGGDRSECGFTVIEVLVGAAIAATVTLALVVMVTAFVRWSKHAAAAVAAQDSVEHLADRLRSESSGAWAVFRPAADVLGADNSDGHEIDLFTEDALRRRYYWAYRFDRETQSVTRYVYASPGAGATRTSDVYSGITGFSVAQGAADQLALAGSPVYDPLFAASTIADASVTFDGTTPGGNAVSVVTIAASYQARRVALTAGTAPAAFTLVLDYTPSPPPPQQLCGNGLGGDPSSGGC